MASSGGGGSLNLFLDPIVDAGQNIVHRNAINLGFILVVGVGCTLLALIILASYLGLPPMKLHTDVVTNISGRDVASTGGYDHYFEGAGCKPYTTASQISTAHLMSVWKFVRTGITIQRQDTVVPTVWHDVTVTHWSKYVIVKADSGGGSRATCHVGIPSVLQMMTPGTFRVSFQGQLVTTDIAKVVGVAPTAAEISAALDEFNDRGTTTIVSTVTLAAVIPPLEVTLPNVSILTKEFII